MSSFWTKIVGKLESALNKAINKFLDIDVLDFFVDKIVDYGFKIIKHEIKDILDGIGKKSLDVHGNSGNNEYLGSTLGDKLYGGLGKDQIFGGKGGDLIYGGTAEYSPNDARDLLYGGAGNDKIYGNGGDDGIFGGRDNDTLYGGKGNDDIVGGSGTDILIGNEDNDRFIYTGMWDTTIPGKTNIQGRDIILDFQQGRDKVDFSLVDANSRVAGNQHWKWGGEVKDTKIDLKDHVGELWVYHPSDASGPVLIAWDGNSNGPNLQVELRGFQGTVGAGDVIG